LTLVGSSFGGLSIREADDDHLLYETFPALDWRRLLAG
jgi:hypothetical protein